MGVERRFGGRPFRFGSAAGEAPVEMFDGRGERERERERIRIRIRN